MNSYNDQDRGATERFTVQEKKPWVTPSLQIIALRSAENGGQTGAHDGFGKGVTRSRS
jgi:hypothetical protein